MWKKESQASALWKQSTVHILLSLSIIPAYTVSIQIENLQLLTCVSNFSNLTLKYYTKCNLLELEFKKINQKMFFRLNYDVPEGQRILRRLSEDRGKLPLPRLQMECPPLLKC